MADGYSVAAWVAAHTALLAEMLDDTTAEPTLKLYDAGPVQLAEFVIDDAGSSVAAGTGDITILIATQEDAALASSTAAYLDFCDGDGDVHYRLSCQQSTVAFIC